jgi:hypothetical protein
VHRVLLTTAWLLAAALAWAGCLDGVHHDGPWPCNSSFDCSGVDVCIPQSGLGLVCVPPGSCRNTGDCLFPLTCLGGRCTSCGSGSSCADGGADAGSSTSPGFCSGYTSCDTCVQANPCAWCNTGECVDPTVTSCSFVSTTPAQCVVNEACAPCQGRTGVSAVCTTLPFECVCQGGTAPTNSSCLYVNAAYTPAWCCP